MPIEHLNSRFAALLERTTETDSKTYKVLGHNSALGLAFSLVHSADSKISDLPHLVVCSSTLAARQIAEQISFFDPNRRVEVLPHFDVSPYSTLYPQQGIAAERVRWLAYAQSAKVGEIFITSIGALQQASLPFQKLSDSIHHFKVGDEVPTDMAKLLGRLGYSSVSAVEDVGQYALRGGVLDIFSAGHSLPVRIELFGDDIDSLRFFDPNSQRSTEETKSFTLIPCREVLYEEGQDESLLGRFRESIKGRPIDPAEVDSSLQSLLRQRTFPGIEFLLPYFYEKTDQPLEHFSTELNIWILDPIEVTRSADTLIGSMKGEFATSEDQLIRPEVSELFASYEQLAFPPDSRRFLISTIDLQDFEEAHTAETLEYRAYPTQEFSNLLQRHAPGSDEWMTAVREKLTAWRDDHYAIFVASKSQGQAERLRILLERLEFKTAIPGEKDYLWEDWLSEQRNNPRIIHVVPRSLAESLRLAEEDIIFLREEDFFGKKSSSVRKSAQKQFHEKAQRITFGDLNPGDLIVHKKHGVGRYEGLEVMPIQGIDTEFLQVHYKGKDKLYVPVYRIGDIQKYSGAAASISLDKLGGVQFMKTKGKVRNALRDLASELLKLYALRKEAKRPAFSPPEKDYLGFEAAFPYDETEDQMRAINDIMSDLMGETPMDRLICGDVGFGKTEVAMRAAFKAVQEQKQVAVLAPTTVLTFQHLETFRKRFKSWPVRIESLNRFVPKAEQKEIIQDMKLGKVDIVIGTHRLLSKEIGFKDLGLLIIDEEQKFGVAHKEKIRKFKVSVDTLALSATPIPRTLNMSMVGIRDLSLINTPPIDRLPTRTFICKFNEDTIKKAVESEVKRGGQIFFIHNRVQSIYGLADELRSMLPDVRLRVAHGQMDEGQLESAMLAFFKHEIDMLVCTTIVESGMDIPNANTMFIDNANMFGLSQLYQLRGRVGRSKQRAYCYLIVPRSKPLDKDAQERLRIIQENTALGSGIRIAQHDLELRGAGNLLGEDQSGNVNSVGYEMYMELLEEVIAEARGEEIHDELDPEINLRVPALIPHQYIQDVRIRLSYYKAMTQIEGPEDADNMEEELRDQFGKPPEQVYNLLGIMLIRSSCKKLGVRELRSGSKNISLSFTEHTPLKVETVIQLASRENKKYSLTPDSQLLVRINEIAWPRVYDELTHLLNLV